MVNHHYFIEASAGTGKTYTIEKHFVQRLLEPMPDGRFLKVSEIAVLTFTRACAKELRARIKKALERESHEERLRTACQELDSCCISTIHGFCFKMLSDYFEHQGTCYEQATSAQYQTMVSDFLATALPIDTVSVGQLTRILQKRRDIKTAIVQALSSHWFCEEPFEDNEKLIQKLHERRASCQFHPEELEELSNHFTGLRTRDGVLKEEVQKSFSAFSELFKETPDFTKIIRSPPFFSSLFSTPKKGRAPDVSFYLAFDPLIRGLADEELLFKRLVLRCRDFVRVEMKKRKLFSHDELLYQMAINVEHEGFRRYVSERYSSIFIDEFQDTDPLQWDIISRLFVQPKKSFVTLIGDPKQSIYAFRGADVYSYLQAKKELPDAIQKSLSTNYRSTPSLVQALNTLFANKELFLLPKLQEKLHSEVCLAANSEEKVTPSLHFFVAESGLGRKRNWPTEEVEEELLFPFIGSEIVKMGAPFNRFCVLVKDRHQAERIEQFLKAKNIPATCWRRPTVVSSRAYQLFERLIAHIREPRDRGKLMQFLSLEPFFDNDPINIDSLELWAEHVQRALEWKKSYETRGLGGLFSLFLDHSMSVPIELARDLERIFDYFAPKKLTLRAILTELERLKNDDEEKEALTAWFDPLEDAVQIVTIHSSKGLEFDFVFGLGLASRTQPVQNEDEEAEKLRQFYVGCTRAKRALYLPLLIDSDAKSVQRGTESPIERYFASIADPVERLVDKSEGTIDLLNVVPSRLEPLPQQQTRAVVARDELVLEKPLQIDSFSSMKSRQKLGKPQKDVELPAGPETGILFHSIMQKCIQKNSFGRDIIDDELFGTHLQGFEEEFEKMIQGALHASLSTFSLKDINLAQAFCEMDFLYEEAPNRYLRGVVDLAFEKDDVTYLLDWKTTIVEEPIENIIKQNGYDQQAKIYARAWIRYLASCTREKKFGGFFFLFVRALPCTAYFIPQEELVHGS